MKKLFMKKFINIPLWIIGIVIYMWCLTQCGHLLSASNDTQVFIGIVLLTILIGFVIFIASKLLKHFEKKEL